MELSTVLFWPHKRLSVHEFSIEDGRTIETEGGYLLLFKFVRVDGVRRQLQAYLNCDQ